VPIEFINDGFINVQEVSDECRQQGALTRAHVSDDTDELALLDGKIELL